MECEPTEAHDTNFQDKSTLKARQKNTNLQQAFKSLERITNNVRNQEKELKMHETQRQNLLAQMKREQDALDQMIKQAAILQRGIDLRRHRIEQYTASC